MSPFTIPHRLKRMNARISISSPNRTGEMSKSTNNIHLEPVSPVTVNRMLRILLGDPWDHYNYVHSCEQDIVAKQKVSYFKLVNIRQYHSTDILEKSRLLSSIQCPNIATVYSLYCDGNKTFVVTEYLDTSLPQLQLEKYYLEEWEIATIMAEVLKGVAYMSSLKLSCRNISRANIRLSLGGEVKLALDFQELQHDHLHENSKVSEVLLDFPILAELIEEMMLSRYHLTSDDEKWSEDALSFLSCTLSGSLEALINVRPLTCKYRYNH
ncbi:hypothetical protein BGZ60DRAFT_404015 [Tricladium varicosporioides]|nr:hypothetical protein BGZ60DRAFT_404015 [Hymenoscyphus varicosporioides]